MAPMIRRDFRLESFRINRPAVQSLLLACSVLISRHPLAAQNLVFQGQASAWMTAGESRHQAGIRYMPALFAECLLPDKWTAAAEFSLNAAGSATREACEGRLKAYRCWMRAARTRFEFRAGLQNIGFGPSVMFRPLMWFDRIDPTDPLRVTDGVWALLARYTSPGNSSLWIWALAGNGELKGWESIPSDPSLPEWGGRFQMSVPRGEAGLSLHRRRADLEKGLLGALPLGSGTAAETRGGLDIRFDAGIGLWGEAAWTRRELELLPGERMFGAGMDYTAGLGNGLYALAEYFHMDVSGLPEGSFSLYALLVRYPPGLLDEVSGILFHDPLHGAWYRFIRWQRNFDRWSFLITGFFNPEAMRIGPGFGNENLYSGKGIEVMAVWNH
ncbi:hypothetical protein JW906_12030 [bacterium]|nr:hypothetical protein [bacterium]